MPLSSRACRGGGLSRSRTVSPSRTFLFSSSSCAGCQPHRNARSLRPYFSSGSASLIFSPQQCFGEKIKDADPDEKYGRKRSEEHTSELQSQSNLVCRLLLEKKKKKKHH